MYMFALARSGLTGPGRVAETSDSATHFRHASQASICSLIPSQKSVAIVIVMSCGSVGPVPADRPPPHWVIGLIRLTGNQLATATEELRLRLASPGRGERDFSEYGTTPWDGTVLPDSPLIVRVHGRLNSGFVPRANAMPSSYVLVVHLNDGQNIVVTGPLDPPWPTG